MELTCLPPATLDHQAGAVGDEKKTWAQLDEEDTFVMNPGLESIVEERTLEGEEIIEEDETKSLIPPSGLASSLFWPFRSLSGNNFPYFPDNFLDTFPLPLSSSIFIFGNITLPHFQLLFLIRNISSPTNFQQISQSAILNLT